MQGVQKSPPLHPHIARQITIAVWEQPSVRSDWNILLFSCSGRGRRCGCLLRGARNQPANDRFAGWNSCRRGTSALSTKIDSLGRDHKSHLLPSAQRKPHSQPLVLLARFPGGTRERRTRFGKRSRDRREKSPQRHNSPLRTRPVKSRVVLLAAKNHNPFSIDGK